MGKKNFGLILSNPRPADWRFGGITGIDDNEPLCSDGNWLPYLPDKEIQHNAKFDTMACVSFSLLNAVETLARRKYGGVWNLSDRFLAKISGTTKQGNGFWEVAEAFRKNGAVDQDEWPFISAFDWDAYYAPIPDDVIADGKKWLDNWRFNYEFVSEDADSLMAALKFAPIQVAIHAYPTQKNGIYQRSELRSNHGVTLVAAVPGEYWWIFDHYESVLKKFAWDTKFWCAIKPSIIKTSEIIMPTFDFKDNYLYQLIDAPGGFGWYRGGKLYADQSELTKINLSWQVANNGDTKGKVAAIKLADWNSVKHYNLKKEIVYEPK